MVLAYVDAADLLREAVPEFGEAIDEHIAFNGELLAHPLFGDLVRFLLGARAAGDDELVTRVLAFADLALREGDGEMQNLIALSFVHNVEPWNDEMLPFIHTWPQQLGWEAYNQRT